MPNQSVTNIANAIINKINSLISSHNSDNNAHQDIRNSIPKIFYAACDCSEQNELIELECEDWNTEQGNIIYVRFNNVDNHDRTDVMVLNINEESIPLHHNTTDFYNITPLTLFRDTVVKFTCYFIDENRPIFLYEFSTLTSELYNDIGFITSSSVPSASSATPLSDTQNGGVGTGTTWARSDHTHPKSSLYAESTHTHSIDDTDLFDVLDCINTNFDNFPLWDIVFNTNNYNGHSNKNCSVANNVLTNNAVGSISLNTEFISLTNYTLEFDYYTSAGNRNGFYFGADPSLEDGVDIRAGNDGLQVVVDIKNTLVETFNGNSSSATNVYTHTSNLLTKGTHHIKIIRDGVNVTFYIDDVELYTYANTQYNTIGLNKWGYGYNTISNIEITIGD